MNQPPPSLLKKALSHQWTAEKLAAQDRKSIVTIRERALIHGATDLVALCEVALAQKPITNSKPNGVTAPRHAADAVVIEYHFVCEKGRGVTEDGNGRFRSGSWVVAVSNVRKSIQHGAYLALHEARSEKSYRQGKIVDFHRKLRDMVPETDAGASPQIQEGIEFLVEDTSDSFEWVGGGAGEKGYRWAESSLADVTGGEPAPQSQEATE